MSAVAAPFVGAGSPRQRRPGYWQVLRGVLLGQVLGTVALTGVCWLLSALKLVGVGQHAFAVFLPWRIEGLWSLAAAVGWAVIICTLIGACVCNAMERRTETRISLGVCVFAVALGGYGSMLLGGTSAGELLLAVFLAPAVVRLAAFERDGAPRRPAWPIDLRGRPTAVILAVAALLLVAPYSVLHPFAADGESWGTQGQAEESSTSDLHAVVANQRVEAGVGLQGGRLPMTVTGVRLLGNIAALRITGVGLTPNEPAGSWPRGAAPPVHLRAGESLWISYTVALRRCPASASVDRVRLSYRVLGIDMSQTVIPLHSTRLTCGEGISG
jgi:hypothetical protein